jgi:L-aspartate oxidase
MGDGVAMAARAGAELADLEFVQFHPTALASGADPRPLLTEALRGEGATLVDETGDRFTLATDPAGELAPRDVVARATYRHLAGGHAAYLDAREAVGERFPERFPTVFAHAQRAGLDPRRDLLPVSPAAHYCMGGVATDDRGRTTVRGLWAAGEVASTGLHGANRLASNSLVEGVVMGRRVAADILAAGGALGAEAGEPAAAVAGPVEVPIGAVASVEADVEGVVEGVRKVLWDRVGLERDGAGLLAARDELASLAARVGASRPARNAVLVAELVVEAASARTESRGAHHRRDHPTTDPTAARRRATRRAPVATEAWTTGLDGGALVPAAVATLAVAR